MRTRPHWSPPQQVSAAAERRGPEGIMTTMRRSSPAVLLLLAASEVANELYNPERHRSRLRIDHRRVVQLPLPDRPGCVLDARPDRADLVRHLVGRRP